MSALVLTALPAAASDELLTVTVTEAGPDRAVPAGRPFYLAGEAGEAVDRIQPIIVRKSTTWMFGGHGGSCSALQARFKELRASRGENALEIEPGVAAASTLWTGATEGFRAFVPQAWLRGADVSGKTPFKVLVDGGDDFFEPAGSFCIFLYQRTKDTKSDTKTVKDALLSSARNHLTCAATFGASLAECADCRSGDESKRVPALKALCKELEACRSIVEDRRANALAEITKNVPDQVRDKLEESIRQVEDLPYALESGPRTIHAVFNSWIQTDPSKPPTAFFRLLDIAPQLDPTKGLGRAVALLLVHHGVLTVQAGTGAFYSGDGKTKVDALSLLADGQIGIAARGGRENAVVLEKRTNELTLPGTDATLRDLLDLPKSHVRLGDERVPLTKLRDMLAAVLARPGPLSPDDDKTLTDAIDAIDRIDRELLTLIVRARPPPARPKAGKPGGLRRAGALPITSTERDIEVALGGVFRELLVPCSEDELRAWIPVVGDCDSPSCSATPEADGWPGFPVGSSPLGVLSNALSAFREASQSWAAVDKTLALVSSEIAVTAVARAFETRVEFTQETWIFSYVTPTIGYALPLGAAELFAINYVAAQIHFMPNPVDVPQWTQGLWDLGRAVALELGIGTTLGPFGPDNRFRGWKGLPPLFVGVGFHAIPYTSFSAGITLLERRTSTIVQEAYQPFLSAFLGLNVQINVPDLVVAIKGRQVTTSASK